MFPAIFIVIFIVISDIAILNTIEWTKHLDRIWKKNKASDDRLTWQYFGSQTGVMRIYPGQSSDSILVNVCDVFFSFLQRVSYADYRAFLLAAVNPSVRPSVHPSDRLSDTRW